MKRIAFIAVTMLMALAATAKDIKTLVVTTQPLMHCENCENKIKDNMRFEKGIKKIETDLETKTVTITYDADKNNAESIMKAFNKIGYEAAPATTEGCQKAEGCCQKAEGCCQKAEGCCQKAEGQCQKAEGQCQKAEGQCQKAEGQCQKAEGQCQKAEGCHAEQAKDCCK